MCPTPVVQAAAALGEQQAPLDGRQTRFGIIFFDGPCVSESGNLGVTYENSNKIIMKILHKMLLKSRVPAEFLN